MRTQPALCIDHRFLCPDLAEFVNQHSRLPRLGDAIAPWHYRGWLLP